MKACLRLTLIIVISIVAAMPVMVSADSRSVIIYQHDAAGHIIGIEGTISANPPAIEALTPNTLRIGPEQVIVATGTDLINASITTDSSGLVVSQVNTGNATTAGFTLQADQNVSLGLHTLSFTTTLGSTTAPMTVLPPIPLLSIIPAPIALASDAAPLTLNVHLSVADVLDHTLNLSTTDPTIATIVPTTLTIPAGQTHPTETIQLSGHALGITSLNITTAQLADVHSTLFVTEPYRPGVGGHTVHAHPLGIAKGDDLTLSPPPPVPTRLHAFSVGIEKKSTNPVSSINNLIAPMVGIEKEQTQAQQTISLQSTHLGVSLGAVAHRLTPAILPADTISTMSITGSGLNNVESIAFIPDDGIIQTGAFTITPDGKEILLPLAISAAAAQTVRQIILQTATGPLSFAQTTADRLQIVDSSQPVLIALDPVQELPGNSFTLIIHGMNLYEVTAAEANPADGITLGIPTASPDGLQLAVPMVIAADAAPGARVITLIVPSGSTTGNASSANTFIVNSQ